jgi:hypothetical protein
MAEVTVSDKSIGYYSTEWITIVIFNGNVQRSKGQEINIDGNKGEAVLVQSNIRLG